MDAPDPVSASDFELEPLEPRLLLDAVWDSVAAPNGGDWNLGSNWQGGVAPTSGVVTIANLNPGAVVTVSGSMNVNVLSVSSATLAITGTTIGGGGGSTFTVSQGATIGSGGTISFAGPANSSLNITTPNITAGGTLSVSGGLVQLFGDFFNGSPGTIDGAVAVSGTGVVNSYINTTLGSGAAITVAGTGVYNVYAGTLQTGGGTIQLSDSGVLNVGDEPEASVNSPSLWVNSSLSPPASALHASDSSMITLGGSGTLHVSSLVIIDGTAGLLQTGGTLSLDGSASIDALGSTKSVALDLRSGSLTGSGYLVSLNANIGVSLQPGGSSQGTLELGISNQLTFLVGSVLNAQVFDGSGTSDQLVLSEPAGGGSHQVNLNGLDIEISTGGSYTAGTITAAFNVVVFSANQAVTGSPLRMNTLFASIPSSGYGFPFGNFPYGLQPLNHLNAGGGIGYETRQMGVQNVYTFNGQGFDPHNWDDPDNWTITDITDPNAFIIRTPGVMSTVVIPAGFSVVVNGYYFLNSLTTASPITVQSGQLMIYTLHAVQMSSGQFVNSLRSVFGAPVTVTGGSIVNLGEMVFNSTVSVTGGALQNTGRMSFASNVTFSGTGVFQYTGGTVDLGGGVTFTTPSDFVVPFGGTLNAAGTINTPLLNVLGNLFFQDYNAADYSAALGHLTVNGDLQLYVGGTVHFLIFGPGATEVTGATINGAADLAGTVYVNYGFGITPIAVSYIGMTVSGGINGSFGNQILGQYISVDANSTQLLFTVTLDTASGQSLRNGLIGLANLIKSAVSHFDLGSINAGVQGNDPLHLPISTDSLNTMLGLVSAMSGFTLPTFGSVGTLEELIAALWGAGYSIDAVAGGRNPIGSDPAIPDVPLNSGIIIQGRMNFSNLLTGLTVTGGFGNEFNTSTAGLLDGLVDGSTSGITGTLGWTAALSVNVVFGIDATGFFIGNETSITLALSGAGSIAGAVSLAGRSTNVSGSASANLSVRLGLDPSAGNRYFTELSGNLANKLVSTATGTASLSLGFTVGPLTLTYGSSYTLSAGVGNNTSVSQTPTLSGTFTFPQLLNSSNAAASLAVTGSFDGSAWTLNTANLSAFPGGLHLQGLAVNSGVLNMSLTPTGGSGGGTISVMVPEISIFAQPAPATITASYDLDGGTFSVSGYLATADFQTQSGGTVVSVSDGSANFIGSGTLSFGSNSFSGSIALTGENASFLPDSKYTAALTDSNGDHIAFTLSYDLVVKTFTLTEDLLTVTLPYVLTYSVTGLTFNYDPAIPTSTQQTLGSANSVSVELLAFNMADATGPPHPTVTANVEFKENGWNLAMAAPAALTGLKIGDFVWLDSATVNIASATLYQGSAATGQLTFQPTTARLFKSQTAVIGLASTVSGSLNIGTTIWMVHAATLTVTVGEALTFTQSGVDFSYDLSNGSSQTVSSFTASVGSPTIALLDPASVAIAIKSNGIDFGSFQLTPTAGQNAGLGSFLAFTGAGLTATSLSFRNDRTNPFSGSLAFAFGNIKLYPGIGSFTVTPTNVTVDYHLSGATPTGVLTIHLDHFKFAIGTALQLEGDDITITPTQATLATIATATLSSPKLGNLTGTLNNFVITQTGFTLGTGNLTTLPGQTVSLSSVLSMNTVTFHFANLGYDTTNGLSGSIAVGAANVTLFPGNPKFTAVGTGVTGTYTVQAGGVSDLSITLGTLRVDFGTFLRVSGANIVITPEASTVVTIGSISATITISAGTITGTGGNFAIHSDGTLETLPGFGVSLSSGTSSSLLNFPSWLPISITTLGVNWADFANHPTDFSLLLSANVTGLHGLPVTVSGAVTGLVINMSDLAAGRMPIEDVGSVSVTVSGTLFGAAVSAQLAIGALRLDSAGVAINDGDTTTPVARRILYGMLRGSINFGGLSGVSIAIGVSELGPLNVYVSASSPVVLDPASGFAVTNFHAGVTFNASLPSITDPFQLRNTAFTPIAALTDVQWLDALKLSVVNQANAPPGGDFWSAFSQTMKIQGGATFFSIYTSTTVFHADVDILFSTDGIFAIKGVFVYGNQLNLSATLYADLTQVQAGSARFLFLSDQPAPPASPNFTIFGGLLVTFTRVDGLTVDGSHPGDAIRFALTGGVTFSKAGLNPRIDGTVDLSVNGNVVDLHVTGQVTLRFIGTVGGLDGFFHLDLSDSSSPQFWGALNVQTNFSLLENLGLTVAGGTFLRVNTTSTTQTETLTVPGQPTPQTVTIDPQTFSLFTSGTATFTRGGQSWFMMAGQYGFEINSTGVLMSESGKLRIGTTANPILTFDSTGYIQIDDRGMAGQIAITLDPSATQIRGTSLSGSFLFQFNTTGVAITYTTPTNTYTIPAAPAGVPGGVAGPYATVTGSANLVVLNSITLSGSFTFAIGSGVIDLNVSNGTTSLQVNGTTLFNYTFSGGIHITSSGIAATVSLALAVSGGNNASAFGFSYTGTFDLDLNTTTTATVVNGTTLAASTLRIVSSASIAATASVGFTLAGTFTFTITPTSLSVVVSGGSATFSVGSSTVLQLAIAGGFSIINENASNRGVVLALTASLSTNVTSLGFALTGTFTLELNTTSSTRTLVNGSSIAAQTFRLAVTNASLTASGAVFAGSFTFVATNSSIAVTASTTLQFKVSGSTIFEFNAAGSMTLDTTGLTASLTVTRGAAPPASTDIGISGTFTLYLNTTATAHTVGGISLAGRTARVGIVGTVDILGQHFNGNATIEVNASTVATATIAFSVNAQLTLSVGGTQYFAFNVSGGMTISLQGVGAKLVMALASGPQSGQGIGFNMTFVLTINTTGAAVVVPSDGSTLTAGNYFQVAGDGFLTLRGLTITGTATITVGTNTLSMAVGGGLVLALSGTPLLTFTAFGSLSFESGGVVGVVDLSLGNASIPGVTTNLSFHLEFNTVSAARTVTSSTGTYTLAAGPYVKVMGTGSLTISSFTLTGNFAITVASDRFEVATDASVAFFGITASVSGTFGIYADGIALSLQLGLSTLTRSFMTLAGTFQLQLNTTSRTLLGVGGQTFIVGVSGAQLTVAGITLSGAFTIGVSNAIFFIDIPASNPIVLSVFGLASVGVSGRIDSTGSFNFTGTASVTIGRPSFAYISATMSVTLSSGGGLAASISGNFYLFGVQAVAVNGTLSTLGFTVTGAATVTVPGINLKLSGLVIITVSKTGITGTLISLFGTNTLFGKLGVSGAISFDTAANTWKAKASFSIGVGSSNLGANLSGTVTVSSNASENGFDVSGSAYAGFYLYNPFGSDWWIGGSIGVSAHGDLSGNFALTFSISGVGSYTINVNLSSIIGSWGSDIAGGYAFLDTTGNGVWDASMPRVPVDQDGNFTFNPGDLSLWKKDAGNTYAFQDLNGNGVWDPTTEACMALVGGNLPAALLPDPDAEPMDPSVILGLLSAYGTTDANGIPVLNTTLGHIVATGGLIVDVNTGNATPSSGSRSLGGILAGYTGAVGTGQTVFFDTNNNGVLDAGEISVTADARGFYTFAPNLAQFSDLGILAGFDTNGNGVIDPGEGSIVHTGGVDKNSGLPVNTLVRMSGAAVGTGINVTAQPLGTLANALIARGLDSPGADIRISLVFSLPSGIAFATIDPRTGAGLPAGLQAPVLRLSSQIESFFATATSLLTAAGASSSVAQQAALDALTDRVLQNYSAGNPGHVSGSDVLDLTSVSELTALLNAAAAKAGVSPLTATVNAVAQVTSELNLRAAAYAASSADLTRDLARIDSVAKTEIGTAITQLVAGTTDVPTFLGNYTGSALDALLSGVTLNPVTAPTLTGVTNVTVIPGAGGLLNIHLSVTTGVASNITLTASSSDTGFLPNANLTVVGSGADRVIVIQPASNALGSVTVTLTAEFGGLTTTQTFVFEVAPPQIPPDFHSTPSLTAVANQFYNYGIVVTPGVDGRTLAITATGLPAWLTLTDNGNGIATLQGTPSVADLSGNPSTSYAITVTATDSAGVTRQQTFTLSLVETETSLPVFTSAPSVSSLQAGQLFHYAVQTTPGPGATSVVLTVLNQPSWLTFTDHGDGTATLDGTPTTAAVGSNTFTIVATDNNGLSNVQVVSLAVYAGTNPVFETTPAATPLVSGQPFTHVVRVTPGSGAHNVTITAASTLPTWLTLTDNGDGTATLAGTPAGADLGSLTVSLLATDDFGLTNTQSFTLTIVAPTIPTTPTTPTTEPTAPGIAAVSAVTLGQNGTRTVTITLTGDLTSSALLVATADNNTLLPATSLTLAGTGATRTLTIAPAANQSGSATITLTLIQSGLVVTQSFLLTVTGTTVVDSPVTATGLPLPGITARPGDAPVVIDLSKYFQSGNSAVTFTAVGSDAALAGLKIEGSILTISPGGDRSGLESITIVATSKGAATGQTYTATGVIKLTVLPELGISAPQIVRVGNTNVMRFTVTLLTPSNQTVRVGYATANGTAVAGIDFAATSGTLEFAPGATVQTVDVALIGNFLVNPVDFSVAFSGAQNAILNIGSAIANLPADRGQLSGLHTGGAALVINFSFVEFVTANSVDQSQSDDATAAAPVVPVVKVTVMFVPAGGSQAFTVSAFATGSTASSLETATGLEALESLREIPAY